MFQSRYLSTSFLRNLGCCVWHICLCTRQTLLLWTAWVLEAALSSCRLTSTTCYSNKSVQETFTFFVRLYSFFLFPSV